MDTVVVPSFRGTEMCVQVFKERRGRWLKWHFDYKVIQHHIITLLHTPKATYSTAHYKTQTWAQTRADTLKTHNFLGRCSYQNYVHTLAYTPTHTRQEKEEQIKENVVKKNTQEHPPPHKHGDLLTKNKEAWAANPHPAEQGGVKRGLRKGEGGSKTCYMGGKVEQNHSLL